MAKTRSVRRSAGPNKSMATSPKGRPVLVPGGRKARTNDGMPAGRK